MQNTREALLVRTFVMLADSLVSTYDVADLLQTLVEEANTLFDASACAIMIGPDVKNLDVLASSDYDSQDVTQSQIQSGEGPGLDAMTTGRLISAEDLDEMRKRWPSFAEVAVGPGYRSVHSVPMRLRGEVIGAFLLLRTSRSSLSTEDSVAAQALADVATISILQYRAMIGITAVKDQLQEALESRLAIEQAKGIIAQMHTIDMNAAYRLLRHWSRSTQATISEVSRSVIDGSLVIPLSEPVSTRANRP